MLRSLTFRSGRRVVDATAAMACRGGPSMSAVSLSSRADEFMGGQDGD